MVLGVVQEVHNKGWPVFLLRSAATLASRTGFANPGLQETFGHHSGRDGIHIKFRPEPWWTMLSDGFIAENINIYSLFYGDIYRPLVGWLHHIVCKQADFFYLSQPLRVGQVIAVGADLGMEPGHDQLAPRQLVFNQKAR